MSFIHHREKIFRSVILLLVNISWANAIHVISSPQVTNWGSWGQWEYCPEGTYATAFQLKIQGHRGAEDDTALNGIRLFCNTPGEHTRNSIITSAVGDWGEWQTEFDCHTGIITGFQLKSEMYQGQEDDAGAYNLRVFCKGTNHISAVRGIEGEGVYGQDRGDWTTIQRCYDGQAICGIQTQVEDNQRTGDVTSLNNVKMECCDLPNPAESCVPSDEWKRVLSCDNLKGQSNMTCSYRKTTGVTTSLATGNSGSEAHNIMAQFGISVQAQFSFLQTGFSSSLNTSKTTGHIWNIQSSETFTEQVTQSAELNIPAGIRSELYQVVGYCGSYVVYTSDFRRVDT